MHMENEDIFGLVTDRLIKKQILIESSFVWRSEGWNGKLSNIKWGSADCSQVVVFAWWSERFVTKEIKYKKQI